MILKIIAFTVMVFALHFLAFMYLLKGYKSHKKQTKKNKEPVMKIQKIGQPIYLMSADSEYFRKLTESQKEELFISEAKRLEIENYVIIHDITCRGLYIQATLPKR